MKANPIASRNKINESRPALVIGGARNEHGTRICRKVTCTKCKKVDHVPVSRAKKESDTLFCSACAKEEMGAHEKGTKIKPEMVKVICCQCAKPFDFPKWLQRQNALSCSDCHQGFEVWRGSLETPIHERDSVQVSRRPAGTLLRTNKSMPI